MLKPFWLTIISVCIINLILWCVLNPVNQSEIAVIASVKLFNRITAVIVTIIEAVLLGLNISELYELKAGKEGNREKGRLVRNVVLIIVLATLIMAMCRFQYEKIDERGYSFVSPINQYAYLWEDMKYYAQYTTKISSVKTFIEFSRVDYVNGWHVDDDYYKNLYLFKFNRMTKAAKAEYKTEEEFLDYIFINKYGGLEAEWGGKGVGYVLKKDK